MVNIQLIREAIANNCEKYLDTAAYNGQLKQVGNRLMLHTKSGFEIDVTNTYNSMKNDDGRGRGDGGWYKRRRDDRDEGWERKRRRDDEDPVTPARGRGRMSTEETLG